MPDRDTVQQLISAALVGGDRDLLAQALRRAGTARDRQLAAIATAHLDRDDELFDALVRDHLADHPDSVLAAWMAARHLAGRTPRPEQE